MSRTNDSINRGYRAGQVFGTLYTIAHVCVSINNARLSETQQSFDDRDSQSSLVTEMDRPYGESLSLRLRE